MTDYNNDLRTRRLEQTEIDKKDWNRTRDDIRDTTLETTQIFSRQITIVFLKRARNNNQPYVRATYAFNVQASSMPLLLDKVLGVTRNEIILTGLRNAGIGYIQSEINRLLSDSPTEIIVEKYVLGRLFDNRNRIPINRIRMKDGGMCVFDYIISCYSNTKGLKKKMNVTYLESIFGVGSKEEGVSVEDVIRFCNKEEIGYYIFDINDGLICKQITSKNNYHALMLRVHNNHCFGITDNFERASLVRINANVEGSSHHLVQKSKSKSKNRNLIKNETELSGNDYMMSIINTGKVLLPFNTKTVRYEDGQVHSFAIDSDLYMTFKTNNDIEKYVIELGRTFQGENEMNLLNHFYEITYHHPFNENKLVSNYSMSAYDALNRKGVKHRTHFGAKKGVRKGVGCVGADIVKCYSSILDNPLEDWITLGITDEVCEYVPTGTHISLGLYYVLTKDNSLFHGTNWYSSSFLNYANGLRRKIPFKILYMIKARKGPTSNKHYFRSLIDSMMLSSLRETKLVKKMLNSLTGLLGKTQSKYYNIGLTSDLNEVWHSIGSEISDDMFIKEIYEPKDIWETDEFGHLFYDLDQSIKEGTKPLHLFGNHIKTDMKSNNLPMYIQILDQSNIKLHQMAMDIGGEIIFRKTDMIISNGGVFKNNKHVGRFGWGDYKQENVDAEVLTTYFEDDTREVEYKFLPKTMIDFDFSSSSQYKEILDKCIENKGMLLSCRAGTGKSYLANKWVQEGLIEDDEKCRLAFTNVASRNINGTTIHRAFGINLNDMCSSKFVCMYKSKFLIIIDECGMIPMHLWKYILMLKMMCPDIIFVLMGHNWQAKPIEVDQQFDNFDYFQSTLFGSLVNWGRIVLTEMQRYDKELWDWSEQFFLHGARDGLGFTSDVTANSKHICFYNKTRKLINTMIMRTEKDEGSLYIEYQGVDPDADFANVWIYNSLPVMCIVANKKFDIYNSETFVVHSFTRGSQGVEGTITLVTDLYNTILLINVSDFHKYFVSNYASTVLKSQGTTISKDIVIWDENKVLGDDRRLGYTAVTRAKTLGQIRIKR